MFARYNGLHDNAVDSCQKEGAQGCPCGNADEGSTRVAGECERYQEERNVLGNETRRIDGCDMENSGTLDSKRENDRYRTR